jgi:hypothetical protein
MEINIPLSQGLSLKMSDIPGKKEYPSTRLQKGLILLDQGREMAEEAVGFGVPVLKKGLETIFPGDVTLSSRHADSSWEITALFKLNLVEKIAAAGDRHVENSLLYAVKNTLAAVIRSMPVFRRLLTAASNRLRQAFKWETTYAAAPFSTEVSMTYTIQMETGRLSVEIDASRLPRDITEVVVMNEQGARFFDRYADSSGVGLEGEAIGCWDEVFASEAGFESSAHRAAFRLGQAQGARLFRGRELVGSRLAWAGFGYSFPPTLPGMQYDLSIERLA